MRESSGSDRAVVKTYVPSYQKERWKEHAAALDMTQSEFVRTMIQAGRAGFSPDPEEGGSADATPGGDTLEEGLLSALSGGPMTDEDLFAAVTDDIEERLYDALESLQERNEVRYSPRDGGYVLVGER
ncbi:DUF5805 domain-containing protein [Natronorarus salvus]|uniref:DUF5805 domain-containing protein n=1 Tax=Natronorarus salvus TaxID=3117733 RepID=UPI002F268067